MYCKKTASFSGEVFKENFTDIFYTNLEQIAFSITFPIKNSVKKNSSLFVEKKPKAKISLDIQIGDYLSSGDKIGESNNCKRHSIGYKHQRYPVVVNRFVSRGACKRTLLNFSRDNTRLKQGHCPCKYVGFTNRNERNVTLTTFLPKLCFAPVRLLPQANANRIRLRSFRFAFAEGNPLCPNGAWGKKGAYKCKAKLCKKICKGYPLHSMAYKSTICNSVPLCKSKICVCRRQSPVSPSSPFFPRRGMGRGKGGLLKQNLAYKSTICNPFFPLWETTRGLEKGVSDANTLFTSWSSHAPSWFCNNASRNGKAKVLQSKALRHLAQRAWFANRIFGPQRIQRTCNSVNQQRKNICMGMTLDSARTGHNKNEADENSSTPLMLTSSGRVVMISKNQLVLQKTQPVLFYESAKLHVKKGEFVWQGAPLLTLTHQTLITGDIVQGIPRIEQLFEAFTSPQKGLKDKKRLNVHDTLHSQVRDIFRKNWLKNGLSVAVRKSLEEIGSILLEMIQKVYLSQGVLISDKHIEIIIRQMTSKGQILDSGSTGLLLEEVLPIRQIENANITTPGKKSLYVPSVVGLTAAALTCDSFISAASFQETTRVLSRDAVVGKTDFLRGLKEKVVIGDLISAGTGLEIYFVYTLFSESIAP